MRFLDALVPVVAGQACGECLTGGQLRAGGPATQRQRHRIHVDELEASRACAPPMSQLVLAVGSNIQVMIQKG